MTSLADAFDRVETWTEAEYLSLPGDGPRIELIDGSLVVSPVANRPHQRVVSHLDRVLSDAAPAPLEVLGDINVRVGALRLVRPDIVVFRDPGGDEAIIDARHVELVAEVTSPSNAGIDRLLKPQLYAAAGIRRYLRVDLAGSPSGAPGAVLHRLEGGAYREATVAEPGAQITLDAPFPVTIDLAALVRRPR